MADNKIQVLLEVDDKGTASLQKFGLAQQFGKPPEFVGLANYVQLFGDRQTWAVVVRSIVFCLANAAITVVLGVLVALLMNAVGKVTRLILQVAMLLAWAMPVIGSLGPNDFYMIKPAPALIR